MKNRKRRYKNRLIYCPNIKLSLAGNHRQKGAASAIVISIITVIIGGMISAALIMSRSSLIDSSQQNSSTQAMYLAESALERVIFNLNNDPDCNNLTSPDQQTLNSGTFEIDSITVNTADSDCDIKVKGEIDGVVKYINAKVFNNGGTGSASGGNLLEQFPSNINFTANWVEVIINGKNDGTSRWDAANCPIANCPGSAGGSFYVETNGSGGTRKMRGYRERTIPTVNTGATGLTVTVTGAWLKLSSSGRRPRRQKLFIQLRDSGAGVTTVLWKDTSRSANSGIKLINKTVSLPANRNYDSVRLYFNFQGRKRGGTYAHPQAYMDEISITGISGGGTAPDWQVVTWQEVGS